MRTSDAGQDCFLQIEHDIHQQVVYNLTDYILTSLFSNGYRAVTVGECLGDPPANWYRTGPPGSVIIGTQRPNNPTSRTSVSIRTTVSSRSSVSTRSTIPFPTTRTTSTPSIRTTIPTIRTTVQPTIRTTIQLPTTTAGQGTRSTIGPPRPTATRGSSTDGTCGNGITCSGTRFGACCSPFGFCGTGNDFCAVENGCQAAWGYCEGSVPDAPYTSSGKVFVYDIFHTYSHTAS